MDSKYSLLINCGPKELEIFSKIKEGSSELTNAPENRNEIVRRGLNCFQYLIEVDVSRLLKVLSNNLKVLYVKFDEERFDFANSLALSAYAAMISKRGTSESELFESIVLNMKAIDEYKKHRALEVDTKEEIRTIIDHISKSIDIIFLRKTDMHSKFRELQSYYEPTKADILPIKFPVTESQPEKIKHSGISEILVPFVPTWTFDDSCISDNEYPTTQKVLINKPLKLRSPKL